MGYEEGGQLTEAVRRKPYSVVLLDEFEKKGTTRMIASAACRLRHGCCSCKLVALQRLDCSFGAPLEAVQRLCCVEVRAAQ